MRNNLITNFICSDCGTMLNISSKRSIDSKRSVEFNSAFDETINIFIEPCNTCKRKRDNLDNAIKIIVDHGLKTTKEAE